MNTPEIIFLILSLAVMALLLVHGQYTGRIHPFGQKIRRRKVYTPNHRAVWQEWPIRHSHDPGKIQGSFVVKLNFMDFITNVK